MELTTITNLAPNVILYQMALILSIINIYLLILYKFITHFYFILNALIFKISHN